MKTSMMYTVHDCRAAKLLYQIKAVVGVWESYERRSSQAKNQIYGNAPPLLCFACADLTVISAIFYVKKCYTVFKLPLIFVGEKKGRSKVDGGQKDKTDLSGTLSLPFNAFPSWNSTSFRISIPAWSIKLCGTLTKAGMFWKVIGPKTYKHWSIWRTTFT